MIKQGKSEALLPLQRFSIGSWQLLEFTMFLPLDIGNYKGLITFTKTNGGHPSTVG
jgi:hypothetical protein